MKRNTSPRAHGDVDYRFDGRRPAAVLRPEEEYDPQVIDLLDEGWRRQGFTPQARAVAAELVSENPSMRPRFTEDELEAFRIEK